MKILFPDYHIANTYEGKKYCRWILVLLLFFLGIGFFMVLSSTIVMADFNPNKSPFYFVSRQFIFIVLGLFLFLCTAFFDYRHYKNPYIKHTFFWGVTVFLILVLLCGTEIKGAKRWLSFKLFNFQPSEFAKIAVVIMTADFLARKQDMINYAKNWIAPVFYFAIPAVIIVFQKDLGTIMLTGSVWMAMLFLAGLDLKKMFKFFLPVGFAAFVTLVFSQSYRIGRFLKYFNSVFDMNLAHPNIKSAMVALGSGGFAGKGPGNSEMKLLHLPEQHTDFIFPIIGEEFGFIGVITVIVLFVLFLWTGIMISRLCKDDFGKYLSFGIALLFAVQAIMNMAMTTGVIPPKGIPLPFISYGGSSMLLSMTMTGILFNIARKGGEK